MIRGVERSNGFEAWRTRTHDLQPKTRQRSLALVQALNRVQFDTSKTITEQLPQFELMIREYERSSGATYPDDLKIAAVVSALPSELRTHVQMALQDTTTLNDLRQRLELFEQTSTTGTADSTLQSAAVKPAVTDSGNAVPMEVDAISWRKDGGKKGKKGGKKGWQSKGKSKGKPFWSKDGGKKGKKGKSPWKQGKSKGGPNVCHNCGKSGHYARNCWAPKKVGKVEEFSEADMKSSASQASTGSAFALAAPKSVKRVRLVTPVGLSTLEMFDLTERCRRQQ